MSSTATGRWNQLERLRGTIDPVGTLQTIPEGKSWLPILHTSRGCWNLTALYSNTARAHELNRISDWVVIYAYNDRQAEQQCTVVTETRGPLRGQRVVRGREPECAAYYRRLAAGSSIGPSHLEATELGSADT